MHNNVEITVGIVDKVPDEGRIIRLVYPMFRNLQNPIKRFFIGLVVNKPFDTNKEFLVVLTRFSHRPGFV